ncbi:putative helicase mov-10-B.1 [Achroia grisella]|uniref:putative helicase mov-10-B.1 n=1 Tax=Achroia grisella TaxID=688607 RepID=UPI0027D220C6|nr:putative helicase mov-10-B.1 [Achroia grisella]
MYCKVCGSVDEFYDENADCEHEATPKHMSNLILANYKNNKKFYGGNRDGIIIVCDAHIDVVNGVTPNNINKSDSRKIRIQVKPKQKIVFSFDISNDMKTDSINFVGVILGHPQQQFQMNDHPYIFGGESYRMEKKTTLQGKVIVTFETVDIGHYEMPIIFTFQKESENKQKVLIVVRELLVTVLDNPSERQYQKSHYTSEVWGKADHYIISPTHVNNQTAYKVPKSLKILLPHGLEENALENIKAPPDQLKLLRQVLVDTRSIFEEGITPKNYMLYFRHLLWWEEIIARINLKKFNMAKVKLTKQDNENGYLLEVEGLAEKRPSVLRGDKVLIRPSESPGIVYESFVKNIMDCQIQLTEFDESFNDLYNEDTLYDVHFLMSRVPLERMHDAVSKLFTSKQNSRVFPVPSKKQVALKMIPRFYNKLIRDNEEQRSAVQHIVSGTSGRAPYMVFGPPGTGKTMTIVEAILQLVVMNPKNRIMVCTDSNMAADHIAEMLLKYNEKLNINNFILRANSQTREWTVMPPVLRSVSNGSNFENFYSVSNVAMATYRIVVTTLSHAAKYAMPRSQAAHKLQMSHLFIDEAAQASEPATLIPICGLLSPSGRLILAGDPKQLGPVCICHSARLRGLGTSLMERLKVSYESIYDNNSNFITMLVKNFRSDPDILQIPNNLFYDDNLQALAKPDPLSKVSILGLSGGKRAIVFHAVASQELRVGKAPSYFNEMELHMLKRYVKALIDVHKVSPTDIGIIAPYIRQVYKMRSWLDSENYNNVEVGTVAAFQGKEKRVILVSTVRANSKLLDYDAKYSLGFLVDDKRFNVTLTRAKAKIIIIGNPACLERDCKWRIYMDLCKKYDCYHGMETKQIPRDVLLHLDIQKRLKKTRITEDIENKLKANSAEK